MCGKRAEKREKNFNIMKPNSNFEKVIKLITVEPYTNVFRDYLLRLSFFSGFGIFTWYYASMAKAMILTTFHD